MINRAGKKVVDFHYFRTCKHRWKIRYVDEEGNMCAVQENGLGGIYYSYDLFMSPQTKTYWIIVYQRDNLDTKFADNAPYNSTQRYQVMIIDPDSDSDIPRKVAALPMCTFNRFFISDNLNHDVYNMYF